MKIQQGFWFAVLGIALSVPASASTIDLTLGGSGGGGPGSTTIFQSNITQPTGTGVYDSFVRIQKNGTEQGFNTDATIDASFDTKAGTWTHSVQLFELQAITIGSTSYYVFGLDLNEPNSADRVISLDQLELYTSTNPAISGFTQADLAAGGAILRYDMDSAGDNESILLNHDLAPGSGHDDLRVLIPTSFFAGLDPNLYLYLYSSFGVAGDCFTLSTPLGGNCRSGDGFEEWAAFVNPGTTVVPEPTSLLLLGSGLVGLGAIRRKRKV